MRERRGTVVLVEDDSGLNRAVVRLLRAAGFESISFESAEGLLSSNVTTLADCFVLDVHLPGISGTELSGKLLAAGVSTPIIFITAHDDDHTKRATSSADSCLIKPFPGRTLIQAIDAALLAASQSKQ